MPTCGFEVCTPWFAEMLDLLNIPVFAWTESPQRTEQLPGSAFSLPKEAKNVSVRCPESDLRRLRPFHAHPCSLLFIARGAVTAAVFEGLCST